MTLNQKKFSHNTSIHVTHIASGDLWAGAEVMLYTLAKAMHAETSVIVTVILLNHGTLEEKLHECGINVLVLDESRLNSFQILQQLNKIIQRSKPDVIHTHRTKENILGGIIGWRNHIPSLRTTHGAPEHRPPLYKLPKTLILLLDKLLGNYCQQKIVAVSPDLANRLESNFSKSKITTIENGIDIDSLTRDLSYQHHDTSDEYKIGIAGRLTPIKRVDLFINCAVHLKQQHPDLNISFHIYGDGSLYNELKTQIHSQKANDYIHLEGHCEKINQELATLDALLMTSDHEGLPMVLLEAMCLQVPVIAHAVGGIPHLLDNNQCGTLIQKQTPKAFAQAIIELIQSPEKYQALSKNALNRVKNKYSSKQTAANYINTYKQII